jgi:hypothetical protein
VLVEVVDGTPLEKMPPKSSKDVLLRCDSCGKENTTSYLNYTRAQERNKSKGKTYCRKCAINRSEAFKNRPVRTGEMASRWGGGQKTLKDGSVMVRREGNKYPYVHRYVDVMEKLLGRRLLPTEHVHHINGDRSNDDPSNLVVMDASAHQLAHRDLERIGYELVRCKLVVFDREEENYKISAELAEEMM